MTRKALRSGVIVVLLISVIGVFGCTIFFGFGSRLVGAFLGLGLGAAFVGMWTTNQSSTNEVVSVEDLYPAQIQDDDVK